MPNNHDKKVKSIFDSAIYVAINNDYSDQNIKHKSLFIAKAVVNHGCDVMQYRPRFISYYKMLDEAKSIAKICAAHNIPLIVNDFIDLALDINADGVHLTGDDVSALHTRAILGPDKFIGIDVINADQAKNMQSENLDYICVQNTFSDDANSKCLGLKGLKRICKIIRKHHPHLTIVAMGGIDETNAEEVMACGVDAISVINAIAHAKKPAMVCKKLKKIIVKARLDFIENGN